MRNFIILFLIICCPKVKAQGASIDDPNITFKDKSGKTLSKSELQALMSQESFSVSTKVLADGKKEITVSTKTKQEIEAAKNDKDAFKTNWVGKNFPVFSLTDLNGNTVSKKNFETKLTLINFWFIGCKPCIMEIPHLNNLVASYKNQAVQFYAFGLEDAKSVQAFTAVNPFHYQLIPGAKSLAKEMQLSTYPTHILIDANGIIKDIIIGYSDDIEEKLIKMLDKELNHRD